MSHYYTVNETGKQEIEAWLNRYHKEPDRQKIDAWLEAAESNMCNNGNDNATIEIPFWLSKSRHVESLTIEGDSLTRHELEQE